VIQQSALVENILGTLLHRLLITRHGKTKEEFDSRVSEINIAISEMNISKKTCLVRAHLAKKNDSLASRLDQIFKIRVPIAHVHYGMPFGKSIQKDEIKIGRKSIWTPEGLHEFVLSCHTVAKELMEIIGDNQEKELTDAKIEKKLIEYTKEKILKKKWLGEKDNTQLSALSEREKHLNRLIEMEEPRSKRATESLKNMFHS